MYIAFSTFCNALGTMLRNLRNHALCQFWGLGQVAGPKKLFPGPKNTDFDRKKVKFAGPKNTFLGPPQVPKSLKKTLKEVYMYSLILIKK